MTSTTAPARRPRAAIAERTLRTDRWWLAPLVTFLGLTAWVTYATVRVFMQSDYWIGQYGYLTPFYSPCVSTGCIPEAAHFGRFLPDNPLIPYAALSLPFLLVFRISCYYYRKAYYRSFWLSPPACAVPDGHKSYTGETRFPLIMQNIHRYTFYLAALIVAVNAWDAILAMFPGGRFGLGVGNLILLANVVLLCLYTFGCHSCRHVTGGRLKHFSKHPIRYRIWTWVSALNARHMMWAWITLGSLALADFYVMALAAGWFTDFRFFN